MSIVWIKCDRKDLLPTGDLGGSAQQEGGLWPPPQQAVQPPHARTKLLPPCHGTFQEENLWSGKFEAEIGIIQR